MSVLRFAATSRALAFLQRTLAPPATVLDGLIDGSGSHLQTVARKDCHLLILVGDEIDEAVDGHRDVGLHRAEAGDGSDCLSGLDQYGLWAAARVPTLLGEGGDGTQVSSNRTVIDERRMRGRG